jgi:hypothetical protein
MPAARLPCINRAVRALLLLAAVLAFALPAHASDRALPDAWMSTVSQHGDQLQRCYRRALAQSPELGGKLVVRFKVNASGRVKQVAIVSAESTLHDAGVEMCVTRVFRAMRFRAVSDATWFRSPLIFAA